MDQLRDQVRQQANTSLEGVENAMKNVKNQVNKDFLPRIKDILIEVGKDNYEHVHELKGIISNNPEGSGPDNDILSMDVQGGGISLPLGTFLSELTSLVDKLEARINS